MDLWKWNVVFLFALLLHDVHSGDDFLLFADKAGKIFRMDIATHNFSVLPVIRMSSPVAISYDFTKQTVYWTDTTFREIRSIKLDGSSEKTVRSIPGSILDGLAVDSLSQLAFYTDTGRDVIEKINLQDGHVTTVVTLNVDKPRAIALDIRHRNIFWSDWGTAPKIEMASYDGFGRRAIITTGLTWPNAIALDVEDEWLYWADVSPLHSTIERSKLDGSQRKNIHLDLGRQYFGLSLYQNVLYFTDWKKRGVFSIPTSGGDLKVLDSDAFIQLNDIYAFEKRDIKFCDSSPCQNGGICTDGINGFSCQCRNGFSGWHCEHDIDDCSSSPCQKGAMCVDGINRYSCRCTQEYSGPNCEVPPNDFVLFTDTIGKLYRMDIPTANLSQLPAQRIVNPIAVDYDNIEQTIYWTDVKLFEIRSIKIDGTSEKTVLSVPGSVLDGIAVDSVAHIAFYSDAGNNVIGKINLDDGSVTKIVSTDLDSPRAVVLDTKRRNIYWSDWGSAPKIETAAYDGFGRTAIITTGLTWPNGIALDLSDEWLYWADVSSFISKIERSKLDGSRREVLLQAIGRHLFGLSLLKDTLYSTDWKTREIVGLPKGGGELTKYQSIIFGRLNDIHAYGSADGESNDNEVSKLQRDWNKRCDKDKCVCLPGFYNDSQSCVPQKGIGQPCIQSQQCAGTNVECNTEHGLCLCEEGFYLGQLGQCLEATSELCADQCVKKCITCTTSGYCEECPKGTYGSGCIHKKCPLPKTGSIILQPKEYYDVGDTIKPSDMQCPFGMSLSTQEAMRCLNGGVWSVVAVCQK